MECNLVRSRKTIFFVALLTVVGGILAGIFWWIGSGNFLFLSSVASFLKGGSDHEPVGVALPAAAVPQPGIGTEAALDPDIFHIPAAPYHRSLSLIFFADGYLSWDEFENDTRLILREMKMVEPWKSYQRYNIYQIRPKELDICAIKTQNERKPVLRCAPEGINRYLNQLRTDHFKLVVLSRRDFQSWANVARLHDSGIFFSIPQSPRNPADETTIGILFLHLLGHAFGLKDEEVIVIAKADSAPHRPDGPNCAPDRATAKAWWGDLVGKDPSVGYFKGCAASKDFIKPTKGSFMNLNDLSQFNATYGPVSERYLRKILNYCFSETRISISEDPDFFKLYSEFKECAET